MTLKRDNDLFQLLLCDLPLLKYHEVDKMRANARTPCVGKETEAQRHWQKTRMSQAHCLHAKNFLVKVKSMVADWPQPHTCQYSSVSPILPSMALIQSVCLMCS